MSQYLRILLATAIVAQALVTIYFATVNNTTAPTKLEAPLVSSKIISKAKQPVIQRVTSSKENKPQQLRGLESDLEIEEDVESDHQDEGEVINNDSKSFNGVVVALNNDNYENITQNTRIKDIKPETTLPDDDDKSDTAIDVADLDAAQTDNNLHEFIITNTTKSEVSANDVSAHIEAITENVTDIGDAATQLRPTNAINITDVVNSTTTDIFAEQNGEAITDNSSTFWLNDTMIFPEPELDSNTAAKVVNLPFTMNAKYAYVFMIGGCSPDNPSHLGYIWDIIASNQILKEEGSKADVIAYFQMLSTTNATKLEDEEERWLTQAGVIVRYLPKPKEDNFVQITLQKFRILNLTEYRRVILLDGDVMPVGNMDYFFELSDEQVTNPPLIKENLVVAGREEPANAGFFMVAPKVGDYERLQNIIKHRHEQSLDSKGRASFDRVYGWGHVIQKGDEWHAKYRESTLWNFQAVSHDQGLLWYWVKYVKKSFTQLFTLKRLVNWGPNATDINATVPVIELDDSSSILSKYSKPRFYSKFTCNKFICDFAHFTGKRGKPWLNPAPYNVLNMTLGESKESASNQFFYVLRQMNDKIDMGIDFAKWEPLAHPNLGFAGTIYQLTKMKHHEENNKETE